MMLRIIRILSRNSLCLWQVTWVIREYNALIWDNQWHGQRFYDLRCMLGCFSRVWLFATPGSWWDFPGKNTGVGCRALLRGLPDPVTQPASLMSPALAGRVFTISATWKPQMIWGEGTRLQDPGFSITQNPSPSTPKSSDNHLVLQSVKLWVKTQNSGLAFRYTNFQVGRRGRGESSVFWDGHRVSVFSGWDGIGEEYSLRKEG